MTGVRTNKEQNETMKNYIKQMRLIREQTRMNVHTDKRNNGNSEDSQHENYKQLTLF